MKTTSITVAALLAGAADLTFAANQCNQADSCLTALRGTHVTGRVQAAVHFCQKYAKDNEAALQSVMGKQIAKSCHDDQGRAVSHLKISNACDCVGMPVKRAAGANEAPKPAAGASKPAAADSKPAAGAYKPAAAAPKGAAAAPKGAAAAPKGAAAAPNPAPARKGKGEPCAQVSDAWSKKKPQTPVTVPASLAYDCLKSVPLGKQQGLDLIDAIMPYLDWQSDVEFKKNPPKAYAYPGYDIFGNIAKVKSNLQAGTYASEFDFQLDLYTKVWAPGQDGHFLFYPDLLARPFKWTRQPVPLVSISEDGTSLPVIKLQSEVLANAKTAQTVTKINGVDAAKFIEDSVNAASYLQDPDAAYNTMFWSKATAAASGSGNFISGGRISMFYPGPTTSLTFANGTTNELQNLATVYGDFGGIVDGPSMYKKFCTPGSAAGDQSGVPGESQLPGYPAPKFSTQDGAVTGYYLEGAGVNDVAVLAVKSFDPRSPAEFQAVIMDFLTESSEDGKTKLVLDLQSNVGGTLLLGYDLFRQLFPKTVQDGNSRFKLSNSLTMMAQVISDVSKDVDSTMEENTDLIDMSETFFNYRQDLDINDKNFLKFEDKWGPHTYTDPSYKYSTLMRANASDPLITSDPDHGIGITITGYGTLVDQPQYFKPENIIVLYDGSCSSTCTAVSHFLHQLGGVKSVAMGGRPKAGPIQGVGGVKGSQVLSFTALYNYASSVAQHTKDDKVKAEMNRFKELPMQRSTKAYVNARDTILRDNVKDGLPAQYVYEPSDCRLYWTAPMINDVTEIWKAAANAGFNAGKCADGGIAKPKSSRRNAAAPAPSRRSGGKRERLSDKVDKTPIARTPFFKAHHLQKAVK
ncbi:hypothetical protein E4U42_007582 [Claviceps africana]|uniref:CPAF-like PDZ domain-containing protein n=1 Tax=Claviceps africana TaxID=83212 RepID=A0A8K0NKT6_9HYPO|nr:hypothetical protein E4U42_007582 [Claviceps africana]